MNHLPNAISLSCIYILNSGNINVKRHLKYLFAFFLYALSCMQRMTVYYYYIFIYILFFFLKNYSQVYFSFSEKNSTQIFRVDFQCPLSVCLFLINLVVSQSLATHWLSPSFDKCLVVTFDSLDVPFFARLLVGCLNFFFVRMNNTRATNCNGNLLGLSCVVLMSSREFSVHNLFSYKRAFYLKRENSFLWCPELGQYYLKL